MDKHIRHRNNKITRGVAARLRLRGRLAGIFLLASLAAVILCLSARMVPAALNAEGHGGKTYQTAERAARVSEQTARVSERAARVSEQTARVSDRGVVPVLEENGVKIDFLTGLDFENGERTDVIRLHNDSEEEIKAEVRDILLDDSIWLESSLDVFAEPGEVEERKIPGLTRAIVQEARDGKTISKLSAGIKIYALGAGGSGSRYERVADEVCEIQLPPDTAELYVCEPALGMLAERQILAEEQGVRITLEGCGAFLGCRGALAGVVSIENRSEEKVRYHFSAAELNGIPFDLSLADQFNSGDLEVGEIAFFHFSIQEKDLEAQHITSIYDMKLQILTEPEQSSLSSGLKGGIWYPVELSQKGDMLDAFEQGELLYEDDWVQIGYRSGEVVWNEGGELYDGYGQCRWYLSAVNKSEEDIEIRLKEVHVGDEKREHFTNPFLDGSDLSPHARRYVEISDSIDEEIPLPELSFRLQVLRQGGGELLNYAEDVITIPGA